MSRLYGWIAAAFAVLGAALLYVAGQRDRAREATEVAKAKTQSVEKARKVEQRITEAKTRARTQAQEVEREQMEHQASGTRPRVFGDLRMHDDSSNDDHA